MYVTNLVTKVRVAAESAVSERAGEPNMQKNIRPERNKKQRSILRSDVMQMLNSKPIRFVAKESFHRDTNLPQSIYLIWGNTHVHVFQVYMGVFILEDVLPLYGPPDLLFY